MSDEMLRGRPVGAVAAFVLGSILLAPSYSPAQTVEDVVAVATTGTGVIAIRVTNNRSVRLDAWAVEVSFDTEGVVGLQVDYYRLDEAQGEGARQIGPIGPGETRLLHYPTQGVARIRSVDIQGALFRDLHYQGLPEVREAILRDRERDAAEIEDWLPTIEEAATQPPAAARLLILEKLASRRRRDQSLQSASGKGLDQTMEQISGVDAAAVHDIPAHLNVFRDYLVRVRARALRHRQGER